MDYIAKIYINIHVKIMMHIKYGAGRLNRDKKAAFKHKGAQLGRTMNIMQFLQPHHNTSKDKERTQEGS